MKVYALWHGGPSYAHGAIDSDLETFESIEEAKHELRRRESSHGPHWFEYVDREPESTHTPCAENSSMTLWFYDPSDTNDPYPDRILEVGPSGGIQVHRC